MLVQMLKNNAEMVNRLDAMNQRWAKPNRELSEEPFEELQAPIEPLVELPTLPAAEQPTKPAAQPSMEPTLLPHPLEPPIPKVASVAKEHCFGVHIGHRVFEQIGLRSSALPRASFGPLFAQAFIQQPPFYHSAPGP